MVERFRANRNNFSAPAPIEVDYQRPGQNTDPFNQTFSKYTRNGTTSAFGYSSIPGMTMGEGTAGQCGPCPRGLARGPLYSTLASGQMREALEIASPFGSA